MRISRFFLAIASIAFAFSGTANATIPLSSEYSLTSFASGLGNNQWRFDYTVTNNNQGLGGMTGLDGFTIFIPDDATVLSWSSPVPYNGAPGFWSAGIGSGLELLGNGSASLMPPTGYNSFGWWGSDPHSVYTPGSTAVFSVTLGNVHVGTNTVGVTSYFGNGIPAQQYAQNQWGVYSTFTSTQTAPVSAVPEPESYLLLLAGLAMVGGIARQRQRRV